MNDQAIEQEIQAKGKTAPRVTPADIEANIAHEAYFTAADGVRGSTPGGLRAYVPRESHKLLTFCVLTLANGFTVTGESACASPENFDAEIGRNIARQNAVQKIWPLMGYQLRDQLHHQATNEQLWQQASDEVRLQKHADPVPVRLPNGVIAPSILSQQDVRSAAALHDARARVPSGANLPAHQKRVIEEKRDLDERKEKLEAFFDTPTFAQLDDAEQGRLHAQRGAMAAYSRVLGERIAGFGVSDDTILDCASSR